MEEFLAEHAPRSPSTPRIVGWSSPRATTRAGSSWSTRSTAPARRWPGSRRRAYRSPLAELGEEPTMGDVVAGSSSSSSPGAPSTPSAAAGSTRRRRCREPRPRPPVLGLRPARPADAGDRRGDRRADRRLVGRRRHLRPGLGDLRHDPDRNRPARRLRRARAADGRRRPGMRERFERVGGGAVLNNSPYDLAAAALCLEEAERSSRTPAERRSQTARCWARARVPDVLRRGGERRPAHPRVVEAGSSASSAVAGTAVYATVRCTGRAGFCSFPRVLTEIALGHKSLADYTHIAGRGLIEEIRDLVEPLQGRRSCTSTPPRSAAACRRSSTRWCR